MCPLSRQVGEAIVPLPRNDQEVFVQAFVGIRKAWDDSNFRVPSF